MSDLFIIGNGFDLACGLKSTYIDFYRHRLNDSLKAIFTDFLTANLHTSDNYLINLQGIQSNKASFQELNFWDFWFSTIEDTETNNWCDVEYQIEKLVISFEGDKIISGENKTKIDIILKLTKHLTKSNQSKMDHQILFDDLKMLEKSFLIYLSNEVRKSEMYLYNKEKLFNLLDPDEDHKIISFNYTGIPYIQSQLVNFDYVNTKNIHGTLGENQIIFGIDQKKLNVHDYSFKYSKTYRILHPSFHKTKKFKLESKEKLKKIKFYGHSLGEADYSYFQSLFDYYSIYDSNVELHFYYSIYNTNFYHDIENTQMDSITNLINEYGDTLTNKDHGKNLLHKLIIEERLILNLVHLDSLWYE